ncbi:hypothetical protein SK128_015281, partial [Halocaridina rubra]
QLYGSLIAKQSGKGRSASGGRDSSEEGKSTHLHKRRAIAGEARLEPALSHCPVVTLWVLPRTTVGNNLGPSCWVDSGTKKRKLPYFKTVELLMGDGIRNFVYGSCSD